MNLARHQFSVRPLTSIAGRRAVIALLVFGAALAASNPAMAQALEPVVRGATIARDTVVAITLLLMTVGVGMAGYKIMSPAPASATCPTCCSVAPSPAPPPRSLQSSWAEP